MAYKLNAGHGPTQKTGAGIPPALLQQTEVTDEKAGNTGTGASGTGKTYHQGYKPLVRPERNTTAPKGSVDASYTKYLEDQDWKNDQQLDSIIESDMKNKWPKLNKKINISPSQTGVGTYATISDVNSNTGDYTIRNRMNQTTKVPRNAMRTLIDANIPLESQPSYRKLNNIQTAREKRDEIRRKRQLLASKNKS